MALQDKSKENNKFGSRGTYKCRKVSQPQAALSDAQIYMSDMYDHNIAYPVHYGYMMLIF